MPTYETVEQALKALRDPQTLAEVASVLLQSEYPELAMSGTTGDRGRDARIQLAIWGEEFAVVQYSLAERWSRKVETELKRYKDDPTLPKLMVYVTNRVTSDAAVERKKQEAKNEHGVSLRVLDYGWLWVRLERNYRDLAEDLLDVRTALPSRFVDATVRRAELEARIPGFSAPLIQTDAHDQLRRTMEPPATGEMKARIVLLVGPGGAGKTRAALSSVPAGMPSVVLQAAQRFDRDAVGALDPHAPGVLLVDDAHRVDDLSGLRLLLDDPSWSEWRVIMTLRPGYADDVLQRAGLEANQVVDIAFGGLTRPQAAQLIAGPPYGITRPELANHLVFLAKGSPLMLHLGADAAVQGRLSRQGQAELLRSYATRLRRSLPAGLHEDLVTIAALFGRLALPEDLELIRHLHPAAALPDLRSALADASDAGLGLFDGDAFTVVPDAIAPVIVLDGLLRGAGAARLRLADFSLAGLDAPSREAVLPTFAAAVVYGDGQGREALRSFAVRMPDGNTSPADLTSMLREARHYAPALSDEAVRVLDAAVRTHSDVLAAQRSVLSAATDVARAIADESLAAALPTLLTLTALEPSTDRDPIAGTALANLLERSPLSFSSDTLTDRTVEALRTTRAWLAEEPRAPPRQRVALRVGLMLVAVAYEWVGPTAADAMAIQFGAVPAPATPAHRAVIRDAARFAAELIGTAEVETLGELRTAYPALLNRAAGISPSPMRELSEWHVRAIRSGVVIVRNALLASWDRLPVTVRVRCLQVDGNRRILTRGLADPPVERLSILLGVTPAGQRRSREWARLLDRAYEMGKQLGADRALGLVLEALTHTDDEMRLGGAMRLLQGAGERATRAQARAAVGRMRNDPQLWPYLGSFLAGIARGAGLSAKAYRDLASDPETAVHVVEILDLLAEDEELRLIDLLMGQPRAQAWLADHLRMCRRHEEPTRAGLLVRLAEVAEDPLLPQVLEQFGVLETSVRAPSALRPRLLAQMVRVAGVAALDRRERGNVSDAYSLVASWGDGEWFEPLTARRDAMLAATSHDQRMWDLVPDDFAAGLNELSASQRDQALPRIAAWFDEPTSPPLGWRVELGLEELMVRVGAERPGLPPILAGWYGAGGAARARTLRLLSPLFGRGTLEPVLDAILALPVSSVDDAELVAALSVPPPSWVGDLEEEYTRRAEFLSRRSRRGSKRAQAFARTGEAQFRRLADEERARTQQRKEGYEN